MTAVPLPPRTIIGKVVVDDSVNAATIVYDSAPGREALVFPIENEGRVIAILGFSAEGRLCSIELLDAERQIPWRAVQTDD